MSLLGILYLLKQTDIFKRYQSTDLKVLAKLKHNKIFVTIRIKVLTIIFKKNCVSRFQYWNGGQLPEKPFFT